MPKSGKRKRAHRFTDPKVAARRNVNGEIKKATKKMEKLLNLYKSGKKRVKSLNATEKMTGEKSPCESFQGIKPDGERHKRLQAHISRLKQRAGQLKNEHTVDSG